MKNKVLAVLVFCVVVLLVLCSLCVSAAENTFKYTISDEEVTIDGFLEFNEQALKIPDTIEGYPVTAIADSAFEDCQLISVEISDNVKTIGDSAFKGNEALVFLKLGNSLEGIGESAFENNINLGSVYIPNGVKSIGRFAFAYCSELSEISAPDSVSYMGASAFWGTEFCNNINNWEKTGSEEDGWQLLALYINNHLIEVQDDLEAYTIKEGTKTISPEAFKDNGCLTNITIPDSVVSIGDGAFNGCNNLANVSIGNNVKTIGGRAFEGCSALVSASIPESVEYIGESAFSYCRNLQSVVIPEGVKSIEWHTFFNCESLVSVKIPDSVVNIGESAFQYCYALERVTIGKSVESIGRRAFSECYNLKFINIPHSVKSIGQFVFDRCGNLEVISYDGTSYDWWTIDGYNQVPDDLVSFDAKPRTSTTLFKEGKEFLIEFQGVEPMDVVVLALYKDDVLISTYRDYYMNGSITINVSQNYDNAKVMVFDNFETLIPVTQAEKIHKRVS